MSLHFEWNQSLQEQMTFPHTRSIRQKSDTLKVEFHSALFNLFKEQNSLSQKAYQKVLVYNKLEILASTINILILENRKREMIRFLVRHYFQGWHGI